MIKPHDQSPTSESRSHRLIAYNEFTLCQLKVIRRGGTKKDQSHRFTLITTLMKYIWLDVDPVCFPSGLLLVRSFTIIFHIRGMTMLPPLCWL